jgi:rhodanese-related sulfurtransferase
MKNPKVNPKQVKLVVFVIGLVFLGFLIGDKKDSIKKLIQSPQSFFQQSENIPASNLAKMLANKNFTFINVHTPYEGEIEKTDSFIPYDQIVASEKNLPKDKNAPIVLYCKSGKMSTEALVTMKKLGFTNVFHLVGGMDAWTASGKKLADLSQLAEEVLPKAGFELPIAWGDIGPQLVKLGVIDLDKFNKTVGPTDEQKEILTKGSNANIRIDTNNSQFVVDVLWALGLAQKSIVYDEGPMGKEFKKDVGNFASTGGWSLARGEAVKYLNQFDLVKLTDEQQKKVGEIAQNVYRPCCGNSTWFPDCNHGMAALAAIELMVAAKLDDEAIYKNVLKLNSFWFPDSYLAVAAYFARQGTPWDKVDAKTVLGKTYSSGQGAALIQQKVGEIPGRPTKGGGCGA